MRIKLDRRINEVCGSICVILLAFSYLGPIFRPLAYVKYLIPVVVLALWFVGVLQNNSSKLYLPKIIYSYLFLLAYSVFSLAFDFYSEGAKDVFFIACYIIPFIFFDIKSERLVLLGFWLVSCVYVVKLILLDKSSFSLLNSQGLLESTEAFVFGVYTIYFITVKRVWLAALTFFLSLLALKRISLVAIFCSFLPLIFSFFVIRLGRSFLALILFFSFFSIVFLTYLFSDGFFDNFLMDYFGVSADYFSMGRLNIYKYVIENLDLDFFGKIIGAGVGSTYEWVQLATFGEDKNLHNDSLKLYFEVGFLGFFFFNYFYSKALTLKNLPILIYLMVVFSTDNILVYPQVMFFALLIAQNSTGKNYG